VAEVPTPAVRLRTVAAGSVALAIIACQIQASYMARAVESVSGDVFDYMPFWERVLVDGPSPGSALVALTAFLLMILLPVARRFDGWRHAAGFFIGAVSLVSIVSAVAHAWFAWRGRVAIGYPPASRIIVTDLGPFAVSLVLLVLVVDLWRWGKARPDPLPSHTPAELDAYLELT